MNSLHIAVNVVRRTLGQRKSILLFLVVPPLVVALVIGIVGGMNGGTERVCYVNLDRGTFGGHLVAELSRSGEFELVEAASAEEAKAAVTGKRAIAAFVIAETFSERAAAGTDAPIEMFQLNASEETVVLKLRLEQAARTIAQSVSYAKAAAGEGGGDPTAAAEAVLAQQQTHQVSARTTDYGLYVSPAVDSATGMLFMFMLGLMTSFVSAIVDERKRKTLARLYTTPVRKYEIAVGNFLGGFAIGTVQTLIVLVFSRYVLRFDYGLGFWAHFTIIEFFLLSAMGIGSAVAGVVRSPNHLSPVNSLVITSSCMIGGCFWPLELTPEFMQKLANITPQKWAIEAIRKLAAGETFADVSIHLAILALFAAILLGIGSAILKPNES